MSLYSEHIAQSGGWFTGHTLAHILTQRGSQPVGCVTLNPVSIGSRGRREDQLAYLAIRQRNVKPPVPRLDKNIE